MFIYSYVTNSPLQAAQLRSLVLTATGWKLFIFDLAQDRHPLTGTAEEQHIKRCDEEKEKDTFWHCSKIVTTWLFATFIISMCSR